MVNTVITRLDYAGIKETIKKWLAEQQPWVNYNLDGSGIDTIISALAASSYIDNITAAMLFNEAFLATAQTRLNVVKAAKALGYTPKSAVPATAVVNIVVTEGADPLPNTLFIPKGTRFSGRILNNTSGEHPVLDFVLTETISADREAGGVYRFDGVKLIQGYYKIHSDVINNSRKYKVYELPDNNIAADTIEVFVHLGAESDEYEVFTKASNLVRDFNRSKKIFFVEEIRDERYGIYFGNDKLGLLPEDGTLIKISYLVCAGEDGNGYDNFTFVETPNLDDPINDAVWVVNTVEASHGGSNREDIESIRFNARNMWVAQNRAITANDYHVMIMNNFSEFRDVSVWGGEDNNPPIWGKIFICLLPQHGMTIPTSTVNRIKNWFRKGYGVLTSQVEVVYPDPVFVIPSISVMTNHDYPFFDREKLAQQIIDKFYDYFDNEVVGFNRSLKYSTTVAFIDNISDAISSSSVVFKLVKRWMVSPETHVFSVDSSFGNELEVGSFSTSTFVTQIGSEKIQATIVDKDGSGQLQLINTVSSEVINDNAGKINYQTGKIVISPIRVMSTAEGNMMVEMSAKPSKQNLAAAGKYLLAIDKKDIEVFIRAG